MAQKLDQAELENVSGGACSHPHELVPAEIDIYYKKDKHERLNVTVWYDSLKFENGKKIKEWTKDWCKERGYEWTGGSFYRINGKQTY